MHDYFVGGYMISIILHLVAFVIGLVTIGRFGYLFRESSPKKVLHDPIEQKYWIIAFSSIGNLIVVVALFRYQKMIGFMPDFDELLFTGYHLFSGLLVVFWHYLTFCELGQIEGENHVEATR